MRKKLLFALFSTLIACFNLAIPIGAQSDTVTVTCDNGPDITNGVEIVVNQMRTGFTYTATAIGLNGFDPVLAVLGSDRTGLCTDDDATAAAYSAALPTTGIVNPSSTSSQISFSQNRTTTFDDVSIVVSGFGGQTGEFILVLEGMAVTQADNLGDPFTVLLNSNIAAAGVPVTAYMISVTDQLDPYMELIDDDGFLHTDTSGQDIVCDDAGSICWGQSASLSGSFVSRTQGRQLGGFGFDAMLSVPVTPDFLASNSGLTFNMTSFNKQSFGDYVIAFHIGTAPATSA